MANLPVLAGQGDIIQQSQDSDLFGTETVHDVVEILQIQRADDEFTVLVTIDQGIRLNGEFQSGPVNITHHHSLNTPGKVILQIWGKIQPLTYPPLFWCAKQDGLRIERFTSLAGIRLPVALDAYIVQPHPACILMTGGVALKLPHHRKGILAVRNRHSSIREVDASGFPGMIVQ